VAGLPRPLSEQELDRGNPDSHVRHRWLDARTLAATAALDGEPDRLHRRARRLEQDAFSYSTFSAAAAASNGLTEAGPADVIVAAPFAGSGSPGSEITRSFGGFDSRLGVRPRRIISASTVSSSFVWWTQNSDPGTAVRPQA
jgi:hypothetical protein